MERSSAHFTRLLLLVAFAFAMSLVACRADPVPVAPAASDAAASDRDAIVSAYNQMTAAFTDNQLDRSAVFMAADYRQVDPKGHSLDKNGACKKFMWERGQISTIQSRCSVTSVTLAPDGVHVEMATHSTGTGFKRVLFVNVKGEFTNDLRVSDLWVKTLDGWRLQSRLMLQDDSHVHAI